MTASSSVLVRPSDVNAASPLTLGAAPSSVLATNGSVNFGKYVGKLGQIDWRGLAAPHKRSWLWQHFHHKQWQYVALATADIFCGIAIVDVGWTNTAFAYVFDRRERRILASFSQDGLPGLSASLNTHPADGASSSFRFLKNHIDYRHLAASQSYQLALECGDFAIDASFDAQAAAPFLSAIGQVAGGSVHATLKSSGLPLRGSVHIKGREFDLSGGIASFDHSNGFLARETEWRWASAHNLELGFNLQAGYFGNNENALWLDGQLISLGAAQFEFDPAQPLLPWHIYTEDGLLDLEFQPEGCRSENKNLLIAASRYVQPIGTFSGWVKASKDAPVRKIANLVGVTEDHFSRW
ncbi:DUF2804 domain-containing protein [Undibacterium sp. Ren11W]|uniref:DUF2804 domain-containing protein n=1 Tax=Undibacterium sp. Ren11W TaxID=3413045 RepID=UPI003BF3ADC2